MEDVDVDDEDVVIWDEPLVLANTFPSSAIEFFISPRSCLIASVEEVVAEREADFEEEDVDRCVAEVSQAILLDDLVVLLLVDEDVLELLMLLVAFRSFILYQYTNILSSIYSDIYINGYLRTQHLALKFWHLNAQISSNNHLISRFVVTFPGSYRKIETENFVV